MVRFSALVLLGVGSIGCRGFEEYDDGGCMSIGLSCDEMAFVEGKSDISRIPAIDAFFRAVFELSGAADRTTADLAGELQALHALVGAAPDVEGDLRAKLDARMAAWVDGGVGFSAAKLRCSASLEVAAMAAAGCDLDITTDSVEVTCAGVCAIDGLTQDACQTLRCRGLAPALACEGACAGDCVHPVAAACDGVCIGECDGAAFEGACAGLCVGTCQLAAGARCEALCTGECEYTPDGGGCEVAGEPRCDASVDADARCTGGCEGQAVVSGVSEHCRASVVASTAAAGRCEPPRIAARYTLRAGLDVAEVAAFHALLGQFERRVAAVLALRARAAALVEAGGELRGDGLARVEALARQIVEDGILVDKFAAACAIKTLPTAGDWVAAAADPLALEILAADAAIAALGL